MTTTTLSQNVTETDENEIIEAAALGSLHAQAPAAMREQLGLGWTMRHCARLSIAAGLPSTAIVINRAFGVKAETAGQIAEHFTAAGATRYFLHPARDTAGLHEAATNAGLRRARAWQKFKRPRGASLPPTDDIKIRRVTPDTPEAAIMAARLTCAAFDLGVKAEPWLARLCHDRRWHVFLATVDDRPAGTGALFVTDDGTGWTDWAATCPTFRCRGVQRALLVHQMQLADAMGLDHVHSSTGAPVPGDPQHSYRNLMRCGFVPTYLRENWQWP